MTRRPPRLRDQAWEGYRHSVLTGALRPGQFITQRQLVEITGFPLGAIRELVPRLEAEGLIVTAPQRGLQVPQADLKLVRNAFQFREMIEVTAARAFAEAGDPAELARQRAAHEAVLARHGAGGDERLMADAEAVDLSLHETLVEALDNEIVTSAYRVNWIKIRLIRLAETRLYVPMIPRVMAEHMAIIEALEARDPAAAEAAMRAHVEVARGRAVAL
jgi:DNA-binding GntR family transcriptional regulator